MPRAAAINPEPEGNSGTPTGVVASYLALKTEQVPEEQVAEPVPVVH
jgi:hypothetical protein